MTITPAFIGIGAQKCATTWLYDLLALHPSVSLSKIKEIHFFSQYFEYGFQWYLNHFEQPEDSVLLHGEFSTTYFCDRMAPERIKQTYPDAKLVLMLRDPVQRLISNHKHEIRIGHYTGPDFSIEAGIKNNPAYINQGRYATHLKRWLEYFELDQIHIVIFDDVKSQPAIVEKNLYQFLGVDLLKHQHLLSKSNSSYVYRSEVIEKSRRASLAVVKKFQLESLYRTAVKKSGLQSAYRKINRAPVEKIIPTMNSATQNMLGKVFTDEIRQLEDMTGLDLEGWKR